MRSSRLNFSAVVMKVFEFLFKQILSQVILLDADRDQN